MELYPLKFHTIYKEKIWGGTKIRSFLGKDIGDLSNCGETWELSGVADNVSIVSNGPQAAKSLSELVTTFGAELMGKKTIARFGTEFPLLIKFIDAAQDLSIQVHPDDQLAGNLHGARGKSEMWYILQADEGAKLITGFSKDTNRDAFRAYLSDGSLTEILNYESAGRGDVFFLPAGRIHTIGAGLLLAEIQQTSDITYRVHDFDRTDASGKKRELHIDQALEALDYKHYPNYRTSYRNDQPENEIIKTPFFTTNKINCMGSLQLDRTDLDCFKIYICTNGSGRINGESVSLGDVILIPACHHETMIETVELLELLETYVEV